MIDFEGPKPSIYSWNGFDREGGVLRQDSAIELGVNCYQNINVPMINATLVMVGGRNITLRCATNCDLRIRAENKTAIAFDFVKFLFVIFMFWGCYFIATNMGAFKKIKEKELVRDQIMTEMREARRNELLKDNV